MTREILLTPQAQKDLRQLPRDRAEPVIAALKRFARSNQGDVKATKDRLSVGYRLRVGEYRVRFHFDNAANTLIVTAVSMRSGAYKD